MRPDDFLPVANLERLFAFDVMDRHELLAILFDDEAHASGSVVWRVALMCLDDGVVVDSRDD